MKSYASLSRFALSGLFAGWLAGCSGEPGSDPTPQLPPVQDLPVMLIEDGDFDPIADPRALKGGRFQTWAGGYPKSLNMWLDYNAFSVRICSLMFESLVSLHPTENRPVGVLAERWDVSDDKMVFTFHLRDKIEWSDGTPITAEDFQFTYDTIMNPENLTSLFRVNLSRFERPEVLDETTLRIRAIDAHWNNFWAAANLVALPKHVWSDKEFNTINFEFPVVSGPYQLHEVKTNRSISLKRRGDWWGRHLPINQYKYNFDYLIFRAMAERVKALESLKRGDFDLYPIYTSRIWAQQTHFDQVKNNWIVRQSVYNQEPMGFQGFAINMRKEPFTDARIRKALAHLLNREMMQEKIMFNEYILLNSYYPDLYPGGQNPSAPLLAYDPEAARTLLSEAGWAVNDQGLLEKEGRPFEVVILYHGEPVPQLTIYVEDMKRVGIDARIEVVSLASYRKRLDEHEFDLAWQNWGASRLRDPEPMWHSATADDTATQNLAGVQDPEIDALIKEQKTILDLNKRNQILKKIDHRLTELMPYVLLWQSDKHRLLYWNRFGTPETVLDKFNREDSALVYWWVDPGKQQALESAMRDGIPLPAEPEQIHTP